MFFRLLIIAILLPCLTCGAVRGAKKSAISDKPSRFDIKAASDLQNVLDDLKNHKLQQSRITSLNRNISRSDGFKHLKPLTNNLGKISRIRSSYKSFHRYCSSPQGSHTRDIYHLLENQIDRYCSQYFLDLIHKSRLPKSFHGKNLKYLQEKLPYYLEKETQNLSRYLKRISHKPTPLYKQLSKEIASAYITHNLFPDPDIIGLISISDDFLFYLEQIGINDLETQRYLTGEFKRLKVALRRSLRRDDLEAARTLIGHLLSFHSQNSRYLPKSISWKAFLNAGKKLLQSNNYTEGMQSLQYASRIAPSSEKDHIVFFLLWGNHTKKRYADSMKVVHEFNLIERFSHLETRLQYWVCDTLLKVGEEHLAKHFLREIIARDPMSFYSIIALRELSQRYEVTANSSFFESIRTPASISIPSTYQFQKQYLLSLKRLSSWLRLGNDSQARHEIASIFIQDSNDFLPPKFETSKQCDAQCVTARHLSAFLTKKGEFLHAFRLINRTLSDGTIDWNIVKQLYPLKYLSSIKKHSQDIDASIILALIRQESAFNPKARSVVGARGLMQLMPTTAKQLHKRVKKKDLVKPDLNLKLGIKYLTGLAKKYEGNLIYTLAAYNAGPSRIRRWMEKVFISDNPLLMIESIPFKETRQYVKLIYRNIFFYQFLNNEIDLSIPTKDSFRIKVNSTR